MEGLLPVLMFLGFAAFAVFAIVAGAAQARKRRDAMLALAAEHGLTFRAASDPSHHERFAHFEIFRRGHSRAAYNTLTGQAELAGLDLPIVAGDYRYTITSGSGKHRTSTTYRFSYLIADLPYPTMPDLLIRPEHLFDKIAGVFSDRDIDFESEAFSRRFMVSCSDRKLAYDICHPRMIEFLLESRPPAIDIARAQLCFSDGSRAWNPEQFRWALDFLGRFLAHWPEHVRKDLTARQPAFATKRDNPHPF